MIAYLMIIIGLIGLLVAWKFFKNLDRQVVDSDLFKSLMDCLKTGNLAFYHKGLLALLFIIAVLFLLLWGLIDFDIAIAFVVGALSSLLIGLCVVFTSALACIRSCQSSLENDTVAALYRAFNGGAVVGIAAGALGLLALGMLYLAFGVIQDIEALLGCALGASLVSFFYMGAGGFFHQAAKLCVKNTSNRGNDSSNHAPSLIANLFALNGKNFVHVLGVSTLLFELFVVAISSCAIVGASASEAELSLLTSYPGEGGTSALASYRTWLMSAPFFMALTGFITALIAVFSMAHLKDDELKHALRNTKLIAGLLFIAVMFFYVLFVPLSFWLWFVAIIGALLSALFVKIIEVVLDEKAQTKVLEVSKHDQIHCIIGGLSVGGTKAAGPLCGVALAVLVCACLGGLYGISFALTAMLAIFVIILSVDVLGAAIANVKRISGMAEFSEDARLVINRIDNIGSETTFKAQAFQILGSLLTVISLAVVLYQLLRLKAYGVDFSLFNIDLLLGIFVGLVFACGLCVHLMLAPLRVQNELISQIKRQFEGAQQKMELLEALKIQLGQLMQGAINAAMIELKGPFMVGIGLTLVLGLILGPDFLAGLIVSAAIAIIVMAFAMLMAGKFFKGSLASIERGVVDSGAYGVEAYQKLLVGKETSGIFCVAVAPLLCILLRFMLMVTILIVPLIV